MAEDPGKRLAGWLDKLKVIRIMCGHDEALQPDPYYPRWLDCSNLWERIDAHAMRMGILVDKTTNEICPEILQADTVAVLLGMPHKELKQEEINALRAWMNAGGNLLCVSAMGGDQNPVGYAYYNGEDNHGGNGGNHENPNPLANLSQILDGLTFEDNSLGFPGPPFDRQVDVDFSPLTNAAGNLCYDAGCTIRWTGDVGAVTHKLPVPEGTMVMAKVRPHEYWVDPPALQPATNWVFCRISYGKGALIAFGAGCTFKNASLARDQTSEFLDWLLSVWIPNSGQ